MIHSLVNHEPAEADAVSARIRDLFNGGRLPARLADAIGKAYRDLNQAGENPTSLVAVRSSATAEDLPDLSFAGQQDTYLNIAGEVELLEAVKRCWGSLWTARAIEYRMRNGIDQEQVALAVVIQRMVASEASGVLFTANPLTGKRTETVIDATLGLGEALVSGQVEPDHYVIDMTTHKITRKTLGAKALSIRSRDDGGTVRQPENAAGRQALPDRQIIELAELGRQVQAAFGAPQDIEWAWDGVKMYLVQSRPITSLFPTPNTARPSSARPGSAKLWLCFGVWQGMLDPVTPLGQDLFAYLAADIGNQLGLAVTPATQTAFGTAGERLFVNLTGMMGFPAGRRILSAFIPAIDPGCGEIWSSLENDPRFPVRKSRFDLGTRIRLIKILAPLVFNVIRNLLQPVRGRERLERKITGAIAQLESRWASLHTLKECIELLEDSTAQTPLALLSFLLPGIISGQAPFQILLRLFPEQQTLLMDTTRGLPYNVTTEMDLSLWATAELIRQDPTASLYLRQAPAEILTAEYLAGKLPVIAQSAIASFLEKYGFRGIGEIDIGRKRWREEPIHIIQVLKSYLEVTEDALSPEKVFQRGAEKAKAAQVEFIREVRQTPGGWGKARFAGFLADRFRNLGGLRETPKFTVMRIFGIFREALLECGARLVEQGVITRADDLFFLHMAELKALAAGERSGEDWQALIEERRAVYQREQRRRRVPRMILSDGTAFYEGLTTETREGDSEQALQGSPVSPGIVEGKVRVVFDPQQTRLAPGEILVCPATDPAWTPLFLSAGGLVMEVGGMMTHGSVVAREYGIPAVVGVKQATTRLKDGQRVRVDGGSGRVVVLECLDRGST